MQFFVSISIFVSNHQRKFSRPRRRFISHV